MTYRQRLTAGLTLGFFACVLGVFLALGAAVAVYRGYANDLKTPEEAIADRSIGTSRVFDRSGGLQLYEFVDEHAGLKDPKPLTEISPYLIAATIATEDSSFYSNPGVNFRGLARAGWENLTPFGPGLFEGSGGSSITQQLAKNIYIEKDASGIAPRTVERKIEETIIALELKRQYEDNQILEWYLNHIYYGGIAHGAEAAARQYFNKSAKDLTFGEAALLAGLPQAPSTYDPRIDPDAAKARQLQVFDLMIKHLEEVNDIPHPADPNQKLLALTVEQIEAAKSEPLNYAEGERPIHAPHFVFYVGDQVTKMCQAGLFKPPAKISCDRVATQGGLRIYTTLDVNLQALGEQIVEKHISANALRYNGHNGSLVAIRPGTGEIVAYVGSRNYRDDAIQGRVDIANSLQSHGSTMKMFTYMTAFEQGWVPSTHIEDKPLYVETAQGRKQINNWNFSHLGTITVRKAVSESVNTAAVRTLMEVGETEMRDLAHRLGISDLRQGDCGATITLGACEVKLMDMAFAYSVLANNGIMRGRPTSEDLPAGFRELDPVSVLKILDSEGNVLYQYSAPEERQVVDPAYAYMMTDILSREAISWSRLTIDRPAAAKTGTSEDFRDGVVMGYTLDLSVGVWMGNADNSPMAPGTFSSAGSGPMWKEFMIEAHKALGLPPRPFESPGNVTTAACGGRQEVFKADSVPTKAGACRPPAPRGAPAPSETPKPIQPNFPVRGTPTPEPTAPPPTERPAVETPPLPPGNPVFFYTVRAGDTLEAIAARFSTRVEDIAELNDLNPDAPLEPGTILAIPVGSDFGDDD